MTHGDYGDGLLSRAELEIELARLVLAVARCQPSAQVETLDWPRWFETASADLVDRVSPELRPFCIERLHQLAEACSGTADSLPQLPPTLRRSQFRQI